MEKEKQLVMVIDDESEVSMIFAKILSDQGHPVKYFETAEEGLSAVQSGMRPGIIFLDIRLPGIDGLEALAKFRALDPSLRVVMMTAYQTVESVVKAMKAGALDYLVKPLDPQMILRAVEKYCHTGQDEGRSDRRLPSAEPDKGSKPVRFVAYSPSMKTVLSVAEKFASSEGTVLILGESGTGKEHLAHHIHEKSRRNKKPFITVDCASIPDTLFESELFGYEKGAFTGADASKAGRFELADGGTVFLDEIGNVPLTLQAKLLRFIEDHKVSRLGGKKTVTLDIRLIAATNADLKKAVEKGQFREDLYYRISALMVHLPPFRNRTREEKEHLVRYFLEKHAHLLNKPPILLSEEARQLVMNYPWPGNIRELQNAIYSATLLCDAGTLDVSHLPIGVQSYSSHLGAQSVESEGGEHTLREILEKVEREQIASVLRQTGGNKKRASEILDMDYKSFLSKHKKYFPEP